MPDRMPERMSEYMPARMPERTSEYMLERISDRICQIAELLELVHASLLSNAEWKH